MSASEALVSVVTGARMLLQKLATSWVRNLSRQ